MLSPHPRQEGCLVRRDGEIELAARPNILPNDPYARAAYDLYRADDNFVCGFTRNTFDRDRMNITIQGV